MRTFTAAYLACLVNFLRADFVPVLIWKSFRDENPMKPVPAIGGISGGDFLDITLKNLPRDTAIVVFAEENLSVEDFSWRNAVSQSSFPHLENITSNTDKMMYFPCVLNPLGSLRTYTKEWKTLKMMNEELSGKISSLNNSFLFVSLEDATSMEGRPNLLQRHDLFMQTVYDILSDKYENVVAIYTSYHSSWRSGEEILTRKVRDAETTVTDIPPAKWRFYNGSTVFLYASSSPALTVKSSKIMLTEAPVVTTVLQNSSTILTLKYNTSNVILSFPFVSTGRGYWKLDKVILEFEDDDGSHKLILQTSAMEAPLKFSYHCSTKTVFELRNKTEVYSLEFENFQAQPYVTGGHFGDAYDCVYFMTTPILAGLFVTSLMLIISLFGLGMILDIKTMDRFDDPKGKTITVSATD